MAGNKPCVLIGWDGATFNLLEPWVKEGEMPNLAAMLSRGSARKLRSIIPPVTPAAWISILTGMNPGKHGVLDFNEFNASDYLQKEKLINSTHMAGTTILDLLGERGLSVCSLQLPLTYPVWPIKGLMLAGIPNPDDSVSYTFPPDRNFGPLRPAKMRPQMSYPELFENHAFHINKLTDITCEQMQAGYDFLCVYFRESDDFHHLYWRFLDPRSPGYDAKEAAEFGNPIKSIYKALDAALGRILAARPDANYFLISDHGGAAMGMRRLYLNVWLGQHGYLKLKRSFLGTIGQLAYRGLKAIKPWLSWYKMQNVQGKLGLGQVAARMRSNADAFDWTKSRAFAVLPCAPTAGIQVNLRGREAQGIVEPGAEYERLRDELIDKMKALKDPATGRPVVLEVHRREEVFSGPYLARIPDIVMILDQEVMVRTDFGAGVWGNTRVSELHDLSGEHDMDGIFAAAGEDVRGGGFLSPASLLDVAPTLLYALGQPVPMNMDGHVLEDVFRPNFLASHAVSVADAQEVVAREGDDVYSEEEAAAIRSRLQDLGYLEE
jgi:predicted AlkP superfamily phosphohydrolase/phosphomutase